TSSRPRTEATACVLAGSAKLWLQWSYTRGLLRDHCALAHVCVVATVERLYSKTVSAGGLVDPCYFLIDQTTHTPHGASAL
ncbi:MAG: hypothetical protein ACPIOQ_51445, partial [Promethearchaeia archaeon]